MNAYSDGDKHASALPRPEVNPTLPMSRPAWQWKETDEIIKPKIQGYQIVSCLGAGGMGVVWRAVQLNTKREVALKLIRTTAGGISANSRAQFEREVELVARLDHPNIAHVYDSGIDEGVYYYAMELIDGVMLDRFVATQNLSNSQILSIMLVVCRAIQYAHQQGIIHRDLKPSNIIVTSDGQPHVVDFGLAKPIISHDERSVTSIQGGIAGTRSYMSPEQAAGQKERIDTRTDIYSLGVVLYRMLTQQFQHELTGSSVKVQRRIIEKEIRRHNTNPPVDKKLKALLLKTLAKSTEDRYASASDLADDIRHYLDGEPLSASFETWVYPVEKPSPTNPMKWIYPLCGNASRETKVYSLLKHLWKRLVQIFAVVLTLGVLFMATMGYFREHHLKKWVDGVIHLISDLY